MLTLWLIPDEVAYERLQNLTIDLSTLQQVPVFQPHVTLLSGIVDEEEIAIEKTQKFAAATRIVQGAISNIEFLEEQFRCLFFTNTYSESLIQAREKAESFFEHTNIQPFIPHVSFLYGAMPIFRVEASAKVFNKQWHLPMALSTLRLVKTRRTPEHWETIAEFPLKQ